MRVRDKTFSWIVSGLFAECGKGTRINPPFRHSNLNQVRLGTNVMVHSDSWIQVLDGLEDDKSVKIEIGHDSRIGMGATITAARSIVLGDHVLIARNVYISDHAHAYVDLSSPIVDQGINNALPVFIGRSTWLGHNVAVLPGVTIGEHCIIGANSVVRTSIPAFSVAVGAPARVVKQFNRRTNEWQRPALGPVPVEISPRIRLLVTIASYGNTNALYLEGLIRTYSSMDMDVDVVVLSDSPKSFAPNVTVIIGVPTKNPWSLPFAHKALLAARVDCYDIFIYSEDDIGVTEKSIRAFLRVTPLLKANEIAGFIRYEIDPSGNCSLPDMHGPFHWKPDSVRERGSLLFAEFTNEHSGFYLLTQSQLRQSISSGGFLKGPYTDRYGLPETAATDVYTSSGFTKVINISEIDDFFIHHQSNRYVRHGCIPLSTLKDQVQTLIRIHNDGGPISTLCEVEAKRFLFKHFSKSLYEPAWDEVLHLIPPSAKTVLSVGCGWGALEAELVKRGVNVTALPLDSVIGVSAAKMGVEVIYGTLDHTLKALGTRTFDCVLVLNLLHLLPNPSLVLEKCANLANPKGSIVLMGPNFDSIGTRVRRLVRSNVWAQSGIFQYGLRRLRRDLRRVGMHIDASRWLKNTAILGGDEQPVRVFFGRLAADSLLIRARR